MDDFVVIFRNDNDVLDWGRVSAESLSEARKQGRKFGTVQLLFPMSDLRNIINGIDPQSGRVDADVFNFVQNLSSSIKPVVIRISSSVNSNHISKAVDTVKRFLDNVGAWYEHHRSKKSGSEYFLVERPDDRLSPEVDVRVSDHNLPYMYDQPDLDIDPDSPSRSGSYSVPEAIDLLEGFFDGDYVNIIEGEPIASSQRFYTPLYSGRRQAILSSVVPKVNVGNPIIQRMVDEVSAVLRGVQDKYFPRIQCVNAERRGDLFVLLFVAEGKTKGFRVGVACGTDGSVQQVLAFVDGFQIGLPKVLPTKDALREWLDCVGIVVNKGMEYANR